MTRSLIVSVAAIVAVAAWIGPIRAQSGYDRPGGDYAHASVANGDPAVCASRCEHDRACRSWSFSYPPVAGGPAMCFLKRTVQPPVRSICCVSGVRGAGVVEPRLGGELEYSIDRTGGDYRTFETKPNVRGRPCAEACQADLRCRAWTYRRPGYGTIGARCYLKNVIKPPRRRPCCISGVLR
ncbi:MAG: PAN domain-containing protein [Xanthobacteraceae bacterium]